MLIRIKSKPKPKRKPGARAGLTREKIALAAAKQIEATGMTDFSMRKLAASLGVTPTTVFAHFKDRRFLEDEIVKVSLAAVARPLKPNETPADYLCDLFFEVLKALHARPIIATLVLTRLNDRPMLLPTLAERLLANLSALPIPSKKIPWAFESTLEALFAMILATCARSDPVVQKNVAAGIEAAISALPACEFPNLNIFAAALAEEATLGATKEPTPALAKLHVDQLIERLAAI